MKIKYLLFSFLIGTVMYGQTEMTCEERFQEFELFYKYDFDQVTIKTDEGRNQTINEITEIIKKCPSYSPKIYTISEDMLLQIIRPINLGEERNVWVNHLTELYDKQSSSYPETKSENNIKKVLAFYNNRAKSETEILNLLEQLYVQDKNAFTTQALIVYADLLTAQNMGTKDFSKDYIKKADALNGRIQAEINSLTSDNKDLAPLKLASKNIQTHLKSTKMDCNAWVEFYKEDFEKNKSDIHWVENTAKNLNTYRCFNNDFFGQIAQTYYDLKKTPESAFFMGEATLKNKQREKAISYFEESAKLQTDKTQKAKIYYRIADLQKGTDKAQTKANLEKAIENNPEMFEAYIMLSRFYTNAGNDCTNNEFEQKSLNILAAETIERAIKANPKHKVSAQKIIDEYMAKAPTSEEIKKEKMKGKTVSFGCWINQSITIK